MLSSREKTSHQVDAIDRAQRRISIAVIGSYLIKANVKIVSGTLLSVPPLIADGIHGIIDIFEHKVLVFTGRHARKEEKEKYPLNREPLIDLMSLAIFLGLFFVGISFLKKALLRITAVLKDSDIVGFNLPMWINNYLPDIDVPAINVLWIVAVILFLCYGLTEIVFRFQFRLAKEHGLREMEADAMELRSDGWLELSMGSGFLVGWIVTFLLSKSSYNEVSSLVSSLTTCIILLALSIYIIKFTVPHIYETYQNLMNVALIRDKRNKLEDMIESRLPDRCTIKRPIITYHRGGQLFITGNINIDRSIMNSADMVLSKAERTTQRFLSDLSEDVRVQFSPHFVWDEQSIEIDINQTLKTIWSDPSDSPFAKAFKRLRKGHIDEALKLISESSEMDTQESALAAYVKAECLLRLHDPLYPETMQQMEKILEIIKRDLLLSEKILLASWLLFHSVYRNKNIPEKQPEIVEARAYLEELLDQGPGIPDIASAEAEFALGFSWERSHDYDLQRCADHYRRSEMYYAQSGIRSESDRLLNTWGHMETLIYALGDAQEHLEAALRIRKLRNDPLSLSFTYGCLGDLYSRLGYYSEAEHYYSHDLDLLNALRIKNQIPLVMCKQGESRIRAGLTEKDPQKVLSGIKICEKSAEHFEGNDQQGSFFAKKGQIKGLLGLCVIAAEIYELSNKDLCLNLISELNPQNVYEKAYSLRLSGRYYGIFKDIENAKKDLTESTVYFDQMKDARSNIELSLQSIACHLEIFRHGIENQVSENTKINPVDELERFLTPFGGMLAEASQRIENIIEEIRSNQNNKRAGKKKVVPLLDRLIWFIEG